MLGTGTRGRRRPPDLSEGLSFVLLPSVLSDLLQSCGPLGPLLDFDQAGEQTDQQEEDQQAQQGDDGHVQRLQLVRCRQSRLGEGKTKKKNKTGS